MLNKNKHRKAILFVFVLVTFLLLNSIISIAQESLFYGNVDTIRINNGDKLILNDTTFLFKNDTVIYIPSGTKYKVKKKPEIKSEEFYKKIEEKSSGKRWKKEMYRLVFRPASTSKKQLTLIDRNTETQYAKYEGYFIKSIKIIKIDVFGPNVFDTNRVAESWFSRNANNFHINTRTRIIEKSLLFSEGDQLQAVDLIDSERLIRSLSYIRDVKIIAKPDLAGQYVDVLVITQDVWTLGVEVEMTELNSVIIDVYDKNIAGLGHQQTNTVYYDSKDDAYNGYKGYYHIRNSFGKFINSEINYYNRSDLEIIKFSTSRGFVSPQIKYAGGFTFQQIGLPQVQINSMEKSLIDAKVKYNNTDFWIARGFDLKQRTSKNPRVTRLIIGGRLINKTFLDRPKVYADSVKTYYNYALMLGNIGFSKRNFYKSNLIYNYDRTEDIPNGYSVNFILGTSVDDFYERLYTGISASVGNYKNNFGYYYASISAGGFINQKKVEQGILDLKFNYFTPLQKANNYSFRHFVNTQLTYGINRLASEELNINKSNGIRDFVVDTLGGFNRFKASIETVSFTPINILGFRFIFFGFVDIAAIGNTGDFLFTEKYYSGLGLGLRIRNDNLVFRTFEIKFVFFPNLPADRPQSIFYFSNEQLLNFNDFSVGAPGFFTYR